MLRDYQVKAIDEIRAVYRSGEKKVLLHMSVGSGKTTVFSSVLSALVKKGKRGLMVVRGRKLVAQASARLDRECVDHGILMGNHNRSRPFAPVQVCSIDTLYQRKLTPYADMLVIDEAQDATSDGYKWLAEQYPNAYFLAVTATPYTTKGLRHVANQVVCPIKMTELIERGYLVPPKYFAPSNPDVSNVAISRATGDYQADQLAETMAASLVVGDLINHWRTLGEGRPALVFAASVSHSKSIVEGFCAAGIPALHVDAETKDADRDKAIASMNAGEIKVLSNVGIFCVGVDIPILSCLIMARPTLSYNLFMQQCGRGSRPAPGKTDFIVLDHAGNLLRHGCILKEPPAIIDALPKQKKDIIVSLVRCAECFAVFERTLRICPACETAVPPSKKDNTPDHVDGDLKEVDPATLQAISRFSELKMIKKAKGYKRGWIWHTLEREYGEEIADKLCPRRVVPAWVSRRAPASS